MESWAVGQRVGTSAWVLGQDVRASLTTASDWPEETTESWGNKRRKLSCHGSPLTPSLL